MLTDAAVASAGPTIGRPKAAFSYPTLPFVGHVRPPAHPPARTARPLQRSGSWQQVTTNPLFGSNGAGTAMLMTDGTVLVNDNAASWYRLTPDQFGNYVTGTWSTAPALPSGYGPLYFASAVLADGRLIVEGGEYNFFQSTETNLGAIYDPVTNAWTSVSPPTNWTRIGDAQSAVLPDGTFMLGNCCTKLQALFNEGGLNWATTGTGKLDSNSEEGWTLLADGTLLTADVLSAPNSERYNPKTGTWSSAGTVPVNLIAGGEVGPQVLRPDGTVFVAGASGHSAVYDSTNGQWSAGPDFPIVGGQQLDVADGPASLLPDGRVLIAASPGLYHAPSSFYEFNGKRLVGVPAPPQAPNDSSFQLRMLVLPSGQVLMTDFSTDVEVYTPQGRAKASLAPKITSVPSTLTHGTTYMISGKKFNGISQANMYGDDAQMATNYPLVRITNGTTGHVFYARTHDHSSMAVASKATVSTMFDVPANIELGASSLVVVANGIPSAPVSVTIQ
jgi:hypothetical protein